MDLEGLEKALGKTAEQEGMTNAERVEAVRLKFFKQGRRLTLLAKACGDNAVTRCSINIADLTESPFGVGRLSAKVINRRPGGEYGHRLVVDYSFTPSTNQPNFAADRQVPLPSESFSDLTDNGCKWPVRPDLYVSVGQVIWAEGEIEPQIPVMDATATMLEQALRADGHGNEAVFARYEELLTDPIR